MLAQYTANQVLPRDSSPLPSVFGSIPPIPSALPLDHLAFLDLPLDLPLLDLLPRD